MWSENSPAPPPSGIRRSFRQRGFNAPKTSFRRTPVPQHPHDTALNRAKNQEPERLSLVSRTIPGATRVASHGFLPFVTESRRQAAAFPPSFDTAGPNVKGTRLLGRVPS